MGNIVLFCSVVTELSNMIDCLMKHTQIEVQLPRVRMPAMLKNIILLIRNILENDF